MSIDLWIFVLGYLAGAWPVLWLARKMQESAQKRYDSLVAKKETGRAPDYGAGEEG
jgi:hypothetical protein